MNDETPEDQTTDFAQSEQEYKSITQEEFDRLYEKHHNWLEASKQIKDTQLESANNVLKPDFSYHDLRDIDLKDKNLQKANLKNCNFEGSTLKETNLSEALLHNSNFTNTKFQNTDLFQAQFHDAILTNADFSGETIPNALFFRANLKHSNFTNSYLEDCQFDDADLTNAVLTNAILTRTIENLSSPGKAKFENANFKNSNLNNATLSSSDLTNANFQNSTMVRVKLENTNTAGTHFGGADITNALFPRADYFDDRLKTLEEASKNARTIFITLLTVIAYSGLAVLSTKDFDLLIESSNFKLPLIPSSISVDLFYFLAPTLIFGLFFYLFIYLLHIFRLSSQVPAIFEDGMPFGEKVYPWMLTVYLETFFEKLKSKYDENPLFFKIRNGFLILIGWCFAPLILLLFWVRYLSNHDPYLSGYHILLILVAILGSRYLYFSMKKVMSFEPLPRFLPLNWLSNFKFLIAFIPILFFVVVCTGLAIWGNATHIPGYRNFLTLNLNKQESPEKPSNWNSYNKEQKINFLKDIKGLDLKERNLRSTYAFESYFPNGEFHEANLQYANLSNSDFQGADFIETDLREANFSNTNLMWANFSSANLYKSDFSQANLKGAVFWGANLNGAMFGSKPSTNQKLNFPSSLKKSPDIKKFPNGFYEETQKFGIGWTSLNKATLLLADFRNAKGLSKEQIQQGIGWENALYDNAFRKQLGISDNHIKKVILNFVTFHFLGSPKEKQQEEINRLMDYYGLNNRENPSPTLSLKRGGE